MNYTLVVSDQADEEADQIYRWLAERSQEGAVRWYAAFRAALQAIEKNPQGFSLAPEDEFVPEELRQAFFKTRKGRTYRAVFTIVSNTVHLLHVRGPGQSLLGPDDLQRRSS